MPQYIIKAAIEATFVIEARNRDEAAYLVRRHDHSIDLWAPSHPGSLERGEPAAFIGGTARFIGKPG